MENIKNAIEEPRFIGEKIELDCTRTDEDGEVTQEWRVLGKIVNTKEGKERAEAIFKVIKKNEIILWTEYLDGDFTDDDIELIDEAEEYLLQNL